MMAGDTSSQSFITSVFNSISKPSNDDAAITNPPANATNQDRKLLLTLHVLFPNEMLPAIDLLDRSLVTRFIVGRGTIVNSRSGDNSAGRIRNVVYYVRSAQQKSSSSRFHDPVAASTSYEVRLGAWNCSCPAFAFSTFPSVLDEPAESGEDGGEQDIRHLTAASAISDTGYASNSGAEGDTWLFGGMFRGEDAPSVCKHLLACVLVEKCGMFARFVEEKEVSEEEAAGWAAGWGG